MQTKLAPHTGVFTTADGMTLFYQRWLPEGAPQASVLIVHGFGEHSGRYLAVAEALTAAGFGVHAYDTRGHGRSEGQRGHIDNWSQYRDDLAVFLQLVRQAAPGKPVFIYGHSLGALMTLDFLEQQPAAVAGAIISGAPIELAEVAKPWLIAFARVCSRLLPRLPAPVPIRGSQLSHDPQVIAAIDTDPLINRKASARWGNETLNTIARVKAGGSRLRLPLLFVHGADDPINKASALDPFVATIPGNHTEVRLYPQTLHEPHNDLSRPTVLHDVVDWLKRQDPQGSTPGKNS